MARRLCVCGYGPLVESQQYCPNCNPGVWIVSNGLPPIQDNNVGPLPRPCAILQPCQSQHPVSGSLAALSSFAQETSIGRDAVTNAHLDSPERGWNHLDPPDRVNSRIVNEQVFVAQNGHKSRRNLTEPERERAKKVRKVGACKPCRKNHRKCTHVALEDLPSDLLGNGDANKSTRRGVDDKKEKTYKYGQGDGGSNKKRLQRSSLQRQQRSVDLPSSTQRIEPSTLYSHSGQNSPRKLEGTFLDDVNTTRVSHKPFIDRQASTQSYVPDRQQAYFVCENTDETSNPSSREQIAFGYQQPTGTFSSKTYWPIEKNGNGNTTVLGDPTLDRRALYNRQRNVRDPYQGSPSDGQRPHTRYGIRDSSIQDSPLNHRVLGARQADMLTTNENHERTVRKRPPEQQSTKRPSTIRPYSEVGVRSMQSEFNPMEVSTPAGLPPRSRHSSQVTRASTGGLTNPWLATGLNQSSPHLYHQYASYQSVTHNMRSRTGYETMSMSDASLSSDITPCSYTTLGTPSGTTSSYNHGTPGSVVPSALPSSTLPSYIDPQLLSYSYYPGQTGDRAMDSQNTLED